MFDIRLAEKVSLRIYLKNGKIERAELVSNGGDYAPPHLREKFNPYICGKGDPAITMEELNLVGYRKDVLRVYRVLKEVCPFGKTITYSRLAEISGTHPRFVGYCMRINRFPIIIPCHRVVSKGGLGGFGFGEDLKRRLLAFEGVNL